MDGRVVHGLVVGVRGRVRARVLNVGDVARVGVVDVVADGLRPAVGQEHVVGPVRVVAVPVLLGAEVHRALVTVDALHAVGVVVVGGALLVLGLVVGGAVVLGGGMVHWLVDDGGGMVGGLGLVDDGGRVISGLVVNGLVDDGGGVISGLVVNRLSMVHGLGLVVRRFGSVVNGFMVDGLGMVSRLVVYRFVVHRLRCMVDWLVVDGCVVNRLMVEGCVVDWLMVNGLMVDWLVVDWCVMNRLMVDWLMVNGRMVDWRMVNRRMVDRPVMRSTPLLLMDILLHLGVIVNLLGVGISLRVLQAAFVSPTFGGNHGGEGQQGNERLHLEHFGAADRMTAS